MTQINWQYQVNNRAGGYIVTNTDWNDVAGDLRALIDQTTSSTTDNTPLPIGIDLANDRVYISDPDSTTPEDGNHADTTLSVVGTTTLAGDTQQTGTFTVGVDGTGHDVKFFGDSATDGYMLWDESENDLILGTASKIGIGTTSPTDKLHVADAVTTVSGTQIWAEGRYGGYGAGISFASATSDGGTLKEMAKISGDGEAAWNTTASTQDAGLRFFTCLDGTLAEKMRIKGNGNVGIGQTPVATLGVEAAADPWMHIVDTGTGTQLFGVDGTAVYVAVDAKPIYFKTGCTWNAHPGTSGDLRMSIAVGGTVDVVGTFTAGTKTFDIAHPTRGGDWRLRHASVEGPRNDLLYRGTVTLSGGTATVDLDEVSGMTDGTWEALCRDPWALVASSGNAVEWSLLGKTLTVTGPADAVCNWMVIAERHDAHVMADDCAITDDGHLVTEYERERETPPAPPAPPEEAEEAA